MKKKFFILVSSVNFISEEDVENKKKVFSNQLGISFDETYYKLANAFPGRKIFPEMVSSEEEVTASKDVIKQSPDNVEVAILYRNGEHILVKGNESVLELL